MIDTLTVALGGLPFDFTSDRPLAIADGHENVPSMTRYFSGGNP